jgi:hypothetical protein
MDDPAIVANLIAGLALVVAIVAVVVSIHANRQANATQRRLVEIEEGRDQVRVAAAKAAGKPVGGKPSLRKIKGELAERVRVLRKSWFSNYEIAQIARLNHRTMRRSCEEKPG